MTAIKRIKIYKAIFISSSPELMNFVQAVLKQSNIECQGIEFGEEDILNLDTIPKPDLVIIDLPKYYTEEWKIVNEMGSINTFLETPVVVFVPAVSGLIWPSIPDWMKQNMEGFLQKPIGIPELQKTVQRILDNESSSEQG
jgi:DNA-binding NtrC family response regulator